MINPISSPANSKIAFMCHKSDTPPRRNPS
jgi:hypothetical protein